jgi:hypothetical protein
VAESGKSTARSANCGDRIDHERGATDALPRAIGAAAPLPYPPEFSALSAIPIAPCGNAFSANVLRFSAKSSEFRDSLRI